MAKYLTTAQIATLVKSIRGAQSRAAMQYLLPYIALGDEDKNNSSLLCIPVTLASVTAAIDVLTTLTLGFAGKILSISWVQQAPVTTGSRLATFTPFIGTTTVTGGALALASAACTPLGKAIAGSTITGANTFGAADTISIKASSVTAFAEGTGTIVLALAQV